MKISLKFSLKVIIKRRLEYNIHNFLIDIMFGYTVKEQETETHLLYLCQFVWCIFISLLLCVDYLASAGANRCIYL